MSGLPRVGLSKKRPLPGEGLSWKPQQDGVFGKKSGPAIKPQSAKKRCSIGLTPPPPLGLHTGKHQGKRLMAKVSPVKAAAAKEARTELGRSMSRSGVRSTSDRRSNAKTPGKSKATGSKTPRRAASSPKVTVSPKAQSKAADAP